MIGRTITFGSFTINNRAAQPNLWAQSPFYYISVSSIDGLSAADISYESHPIPYAIGEKSGDVFRRGKSVTITGKIEALNVAYLETGADFLGQMFADRTLRNLSWTRISDGVAIYLKCRINQDLSIVESFQEGRYSWPYTVGLRADDPRTRRVSDSTVYPTWQQ